MRLSKHFAIANKYYINSFVCLSLKCTQIYKKKINKIETTHRNDYFIILRLYNITDNVCVCVCVSVVQRQDLYMSIILIENIS